jgi:hypothetical protein
MDRSLWEDAAVTKLRRTGSAVGLAFAAYDVWLRMTPRQRRALVAYTRRYGPVVAAQAVRSARALAAKRARG